MNLQERLRGKSCDQPLGREAAAELDRLQARVAELEMDAERMEDALHRIKQWSRAYPIDIFPEPTRMDWQQANEVLAQAGLSMTRMSAANMRHVITQVQAIVDAAIDTARKAKP